ncbi:MAG: sigma factor-like helix-turn-helix DNA-binding protein, partial [Patescibacteria group bacterium]
MTGDSSAINNLLSHITDRQRAVVVNRFGLEGKEPQTLATIGDVFGITRERVRQIEVGSIATLRADFMKDKALGAMVNEAEKALKGMGGIGKDEDFVKACAPFGGGMSGPHLVFLARVSEQFHFSAETESLHSFFYSDQKALKKAEALIIKLSKYMNAKQGRVSSGSGRDLLSDFVR